MKHLKLFEKLTFDIEEDQEGFDGDRVTIKSFLNEVEVGKIIIEFVYNGFWMFEDEITEEQYDDLFPDDKFAKIEYLEVYDKFKGKRYSKYLMNECLKFIKEKGENIVYLNASPMGFTGLNNEELFNFYKSFGFKTFIKYPDNEEMILKLG